MKETFTFYYCGACGAMSMQNFRDDCCRVCLTAMNAKMVEVSGIGGGGLEVIEYEAPHMEENECP